MTPGQLRENILSTYFTLRAGIVILSVSLPVVLYLGGRLDGIPLLKSMSEYYGEHNYFMRDWFVGILCTVGSFLYLYKGFGTAENILLNVAGICAVLVAMIPCGCWDGGTKNAWHALSAMTFFLCMASVCLFCANDTISLLPDQKMRDAFGRRYRIIAALLVASPAAALAVSYGFNQPGSYPFFIEAF